MFAKRYYCSGHANDRASIGFRLRGPRRPRAALRACSLRGSFGVGRAQAAHPGVPPCARRTARRRNEREGHMNLRTTIGLSRDASLEEGEPHEVMEKKRGALEAAVRPARLELARRNAKRTEIENDFVPRGPGWLVSASTDAIYTPVRGVVFQPSDRHYDEGRGCEENTAARDFRPRRASRASQARRRRTPSTRLPPQSSSRP